MEKEFILVDEITNLFNNDYFIYLQGTKLTIFNSEWYHELFVNSDCWYIDFKEDCKQWLREI